LAHNVTLIRRCSVLTMEREAALQAVKRNGFLLLRPENAQWQQDKEVVLAAVAQCGLALEGVHATLQADKEVATEAVRQYGPALKFASPALRADPGVVRQAVSQQGRALRFAAAALKADRDVVQAAVKQTGSALEYAAADLQADKAVVCEAVQQEGMALQYADATLRADKDVVLAAVQQSGLALRFANMSSWTDAVLKEVLLKAVMQNARAFLAHIVAHDRMFLHMYSCDVINEMLHDLPEGFCKDFQFFRITALSGRSCSECCIIHDEMYDAAAFQKDSLVRLLLMSCAEQLGLVCNDVIETGVLLDAATSEPICDNEALRARFQGGKMHDLQLVVQTAKKRRLGEG